MKLPFQFKRESTQKEILGIIANPIDLFGNPEPYRISFPSKETFISLSRPQDDNDGDREQKLELLISTDMDIHVMMRPKFQCGCYRQMYEGTMSVRTGNALKIVWYAMYLHNKNQDRKLARKFKKKTELATVVRALETCWMPEPADLTRNDWHQARTHDDNDGMRSERLCVTIGTTGSRSGDVFVDTIGRSGADRSGFLRFRAPAGGSSSPLVHNALRVLALAMHLDNTLRPPNHPVRA